MKTKSSVKKRCESCYTVKRDGVIRVYCRRSRRHNQRQGKGHAKNVKRTKKAR